jgi:uncharacterized membrane protein
MMYWNNHMTSGGWIFSILTTVIILALLVAAIVWVTRAMRIRRGAAAATSALEILDRRLASGEIKTDQYERLRHTLAARAESPRATP